VPDGGTILVAGFVEAEDNKGVSTLPFVEGIPIVKQLLRGWARNDGRRSYIVLVSAQIVPDLFEE
jgi:type II secretory pathway component HofQ